MTDINNTDKELYEDGLIKEKQFWTITLNSLSYFVLAHYTVIFSVNLVSILLAKLEGARGILYYYGFKIVNSGKYWSDELIFLVFFVGIGFSFFLGLFFERLYRRRRKHVSHLKLYFLWGYLMSFTYFFGNIIVGTFFYFGFGVIFQTLSIPIIFRIIIGLISIVCLIYLGFYATRGIIISLNNYRSSIAVKDYSWFLKAQLLYPFIFGTWIVFLLKVPHQYEFNLFDSLILLSMVFPIAGSFINIRKQSSIQFKNKTAKIRVFIVPLIVALIVLTIYRLGLISGLHF